MRFRLADHLFIIYAPLSGHEKSRYSLQSRPMLCGPRPARQGHRAFGLLPEDYTEPLSLMRDLAADPSNPAALKNQGASLRREGDSLRALYYYASPWRLILMTRRRYTAWPSPT